MTTARRHDPVVLEASAVFVTRGPTRRGILHNPPTTFGLAYLLVLFTLWILNLADLALTMYWTGNVGWAAEGNGIMRHIAHIFGAWGFALYKVLLMTLVVLALWWLYRRFEGEAANTRQAWQARMLDAMRAVAMLLTLVLLSFYGWVVWNNLQIVELA